MAHQKENVTLDVAETTLPYNASASCEVEKTKSVEIIVDPHDEAALPLQQRMEEEQVEISWKYKWLALVCVMLFPIGQNCRAFFQDEAARATAHYLRCM